MAGVAAISVIALAMLGTVAQEASAHSTSLGSQHPTARGIRTLTILRASPKTVSSGGSVAITATVSPGFLVAPWATVTFMDVTNRTSLGIAGPDRRCFLIPRGCPMTITIPASDLAPGANRITGTYSGDIVEAPSHGSVVVTYTNSDPTVTTTCPAGSSSCQTGTDVSEDGTASASMTTSGTATGTETLSLSFQTTELPCSTQGTGDPVVFSATNAPSEKSVTYTIFGTPADIANQDYGDAGNICLGSTQPFTTAGGTPAVLTDGLYYGLLPECETPEITADTRSDSSSNDVPPCVEYATFTPSSEGGPPLDEYTEYFVVTAADPRASN
jgi:hypothetical protein